MVTISTTDAINLLTSNILNLQAPSFGASYNQTPVAESTSGARLSWGGATFFSGGANQTADTTITGLSNWLEFLDQDTNVLRTPVVNDTFQRYYFASPSLPPQYNPYNRIVNGQPPFILGVPAPSIAPTLSTVGGGNPTQIGFPTALPNSGSLAIPDPSGVTSTLVLYPVQSSVPFTLDDIGLVINSMASSSDTFEFEAFIFANVQPTTEVPVPPNQAGDVIAYGSTFNLFGSPTYPVTAFSSFGTINTQTGFTEAGTGIQLLANTQYWIGVLFTGSSSGTIQLALADSKTKGYSATITYSQISNTGGGAGAGEFGAPVAGGAGGGQVGSSGGAGVPYGLGGGEIQGQAGGSGDGGGIAVSSTGAVTTSGLSPYYFLTTDPVTGNYSAPIMSDNFPDLQLWADVATLNNGGEAQEETRAYVYTWVTAYGEEGPPSPPALLDAYDNATWVVGLQPPLPEDMGTLRNIVQTNIYRTMASVQGGTVFFLVNSIAAGATTFTDAVTDDVVAENLILPSTTWFGPPANLQGIVTMPNGMMAGFRANEVWFCEPFRPHAWPSQYVMTTDYPIVGLGVAGYSVIACTQTNPNIFVGPNPGAMSQIRVAHAEPCISRGGILSTENAVFYPSLNGLIRVAGTGAAANVTQGWITRERWDALTPQKFIRAVKNISTYYAFGTTGVTNGQPDTSVAQEGFTIELSETADASSFTVWPQPGGHRIGFSNLSSFNGGNIDNVLLDSWSSVTLLVTGGNIYYFDFDDPIPTIQKYIWRSKKFQGPHKDNYSAFRVWFDIPPGGPQTPPVNRTTVPFSNPPSSTAKLAYAPGMFGIVRIIADGKYVTERELRYSTELMRIASQSKYTTWQVEIEGIVSVTSVKMATSVKELALAEGQGRLQ
jgi:hypothetical protein